MGKPDSRVINVVETIEKIINKNTTSTIAVKSSTKPTRRWRALLRGDVLMSTSS
jgi:hypothetical protein